MLPNFIIDIPGIKKTSGGIQRMLEFSEVLSKYYPTFVTIKGGNLENIQNGFIITYSDNPDIDNLCIQAKQQNLQVIVYQLSYGMAIERERKVVSHPDVIICTSTLHIKNKILNDKKLDLQGKKIYCISHSQESTLKNFYPENKYNQDGVRPFDVVLMIHRSPDKQFLQAYTYCKLKNLNFVLFGQRYGNFKFEGCQQVFLNASVDQVRWIFNNSKKFLNLSKTEGLNRTGIEAMLCGCIPYISDGCEIYRDGKNCKFIEKPQEIHENLKILSYIKIKKSLQKYTWDNVLKNLGKIIKIKFEKKG